MAERISSKSAQEPHDWSMFQRPVFKVFLQSEQNGDLKISLLPLNALLLIIHRSLSFLI